MLDVRNPNSPASLRPYPWIFPAVALVTLAIQFAGAGPVREALIYDRTGVATGELWRLWTGHLCHFGWLHFLADAGLFAIIGWTLERRCPRGARGALLALPLAIGAALYWAAPDLTRYAGLSGINVGLLVFLSLDGWQQNRRDWFWPAVLAVHVVELALEALHGGIGGGAIRFDEPAIRIATAAHVAGALYGLAWFLRRFVAPAPAQLNRSSSQAI